MSKEVESSEEKLEKEAALRLVEERSRRLGMRGRLSWTYGGLREKPGEEIEQQAVEELEAERRTERVERAVLRTSLVERRELQRGASFPGRLGGTAGGGGGLSRGVWLLSLLLPPPPPLLCSLLSVLPATFVRVC